MAQPYDVYRMVQELFTNREKLFPAICADRSFICNIHCREWEYTVAQYNRILDIYNKYIAVPAAVPAWRHDGTYRALTRGKRK